MAILNNPPTTETRVIHVSEMDRFPDAVYIGRANGRKGLKASKWANPYKIGSTKYSNERGGEYCAPLSRMDVLDRYRKRILETPDLLNALPELRGKSLACWCRHADELKGPHNLCHGDVLIGLLRKHDDTTMQRTAAWHAASEVEWKTAHKPLSTIQRYLKRIDTKLGVQPPDETFTADEIAQQLLYVLRLANHAGINLGESLSAAIKHDLEVQFSELRPVEQIKRVAALKSLNQICTVWNSEGRLVRAYYAWDPRKDLEITPELEERMQRQWAPVNGALS